MNKVMSSVRCRTIRELVDYVNTHKIQKSSIVTVLPDKDDFVLLYYGEERIQ